jgi:putative DNA primase/helicase
MSIHLVNDAEETEQWPSAPLFSEDALALRLADENADRFRFVAAWHKWLVYDGARWILDEKMIAYTAARALCRTVAAECNKAKIAKALTSKHTIGAVENLARCDPRFAAGPNEWDLDPRLLNTPAGVVDLISGNSRANRADDMMMKITAVAPDKDMPTPVWTAFINRSFANDAELIGYIQRLAGYALTGSVREEMLAFFYGTGQNGKSKLNEALSGCMGDYHTGAPN